MTAAAKPLAFDDIHTQKKQQQLTQMMHSIAAKVRGMPNANSTRSACPVCAHAPVDFFVNAFGFEMSQCGDCGLIFCNPYPSLAQLDVYYNSEMKSFENEFFRESFDKRINIFLPRIELIQRYGGKGRLLDIGSAIGIFPEALKRAGAPFHLTCCDLSVDACAELKQRYPDTDVICGNVLDMAVDEPFDVVTLWDTVEHIVDLDALLKKLRGLCAPDGLLVFSTPNTHSFEWMVAGHQHVQILPPGHVNLLNPRCIQHLLPRNGFALVDLLTLNASLDISYVQKLMAQKKVDDHRLGVFLNEALADEQFCTMLSSYLVEKRMAGNMVVVARPA